MNSRTYRISALKELISQRILIIDGAMGSMIQTYGLQENDYRGDLLQDHHLDIKGNNDILSITKPHIIEEIHNAYLDAGADIIETNSFNATGIAQGDYQLESFSYEINVASAKIARAAADRATAATPNKPRFVAGVLGPTPRTASISPDVNDPSARNTSFDQLSDDYFFECKDIKLSNFY